MAVELCHTPEYSERVAVLRPIEPLLPTQTYNVTVVGAVSNDARQRGIVDILGNPMIDNYTWSFTTSGDGSVEAPVLLSPADLSAVDQTPTLTWDLPGDYAFHVQLSITNTFEWLVWETRTTDRQVKPVFLWMKGSIIGVSRQIHRRQLGVILAFLVQYIASEPGLPLEPPLEGGIYGSGAIEAKVVSPKLKDGMLSDLDTKEIVLMVDGLVDPSLVTKDAISIYGESITSDPSVESHGEVEIEDVKVEHCDHQTKITIVLC